MTLLRRAAASMLLVAGMLGFLLATYFLVHEQYAVTATVGLSAAIALAAFRRLTNAVPYSRRAAAVAAVAALVLATDALSHTEVGKTGATRTTVQQAGLTLLMGVAGGLAAFTGSFFRTSGTSRGGAIVVAVVAIGLHAGCAGNYPRVGRLRTCPGRLTPPPESWPLGSPKGAVFRFQVPPNLTQAIDPGDNCMHGCRDWRGDGTFVSASFGYWGDNSFADDRWTRACRFVRDGFTIVLMPESDGHSVLVWPLRTKQLSTAGDVVIRVDAPSRDARVTAEQIAGSIRAR